jgi:hypothetical protein
MKYYIYYYRPWRCWMGYWETVDGDQICEAVNSPSKEGVLIELGAQRSKALTRMNEGKTYPHE